MAIYTVEMHDDAGCTETREIEASTVAEAVSQIQGEADDWCGDGEWGNDGASIDIRWTLTDEDGERVEEGSCTVEIEPDHSAKIWEACGYQWDETQDAPRKAKTLRRGT